MTEYKSFALFFILTLLAEVLGTIGGFGSSLFFVSLSQFFFDFRTVLALTGLLHIFSNASKIFLFRNSIRWSLVLTVGISSLLFAICGAYLSATLESLYARLILGVFLLMFASFLLLNPAFSIKQTLLNSVSGGGVAGFLAGFVGTGGAVRGLVLASFNLEKNIFVGTSAAIDMGVDLSRTAVYLQHNYFTASYWIYIPMLMASSFVGSFIGKKVLGKLSQESFRTLVLALILLMGVITLAGTISF